MSKQKKLVIKVNYENTGKTSEEQFSPEHSEEWDFKKIAIALLLSILIMIGFYYTLFSNSTLPKREEVSSGSNDQARTVSSLESKVNQEIKVEQPVKQVAALTRENIITSEKEKSIKASRTEENNTLLESVKKLSDFVARSQLSYLVKNREPQGQLVSPVVIGNNKAIKIYYFTEIKNMSGHTVFHIWNYNGKQIFKKAINVKGPRWRAATYKTIDSALLGNWQVRLLDDKENQLDLINFEVIQE